MADKNNQYNATLAALARPEDVQVIDFDKMSLQDMGLMRADHIKEFLNVLEYYEEHGRQLTLEQMETRTAFGNSGEYDWEVVVDTLQDYKEAKDNPFNLPLTPAEMMSLFTADALQSEAIVPDDYIFGDSDDVGGISTSDFCQIYGGTGSGKTLFSLSMAVSVAAGIGFIGWQCKKPRKVLYLDGELPEKTIRRRLDNASAHLTPEQSELVKQNLTIISRERLIRCTQRDLSPLDRAEGIEQVLWLVENGEFEFMVLDSRFCLLAADMKEAGSMPKGLILALRHRKCAQLWVHHTGKSAERGAYGDKTAEFLMDTNIHFSQPEKGKFEIYFSADKGGKCRHREPENEHYYQDTALRFEDGQWIPDGPAGVSSDTEQKPSTRKDSIIAAVEDLSNKKYDKAGGKNPDIGHAGEPVAKISRDEIKQWLIDRGIFEPDNSGKLTKSNNVQVDNGIRDLLNPKSGRLSGNRESGVSYVWLVSHARH